MVLQEGTREVLSIQDIILMFLAVKGEPEISINSGLSLVSLNVTHLMLPHDLSTQRLYRPFLFLSMLFQYFKNETNLRPKCQLEGSVHRQSN